MRRNKFSARKTEVDGIVFASKREATVYGELKLREMAGEIRNLTLQPKFPIVVDGAPVKIRSEGYPNGRAMVYRADFSFFEGERRRVLEVKGFDTEPSRIKRALVSHIYNVEIEVVR